MSKLFDDDKVIQDMFAINESISPNMYAHIYCDPYEVVGELSRALKKFGLSVYSSPYAEGGDGEIGMIISRRKLTKKEIEYIDAIELGMDDDDNEE